MYIFFGIPCAQLTGPVYLRCYRNEKWGGQGGPGSQVLIKVQNVSKKALAHPKDHLEHFLRPIQATQLTPGPFWTGQKRQNDFRISNENLATWNLVSIKWAQQFTEPLKQLCAAIYTFPAINIDNVFIRGKLVLELFLCKHYCLESWFQTKKDSSVGHLKPDLRLKSTSVEALCLQWISAYTRFPPNKKKS